MKFILNFVFKFSIFAFLAWVSVKFMQHFGIVEVPVNLWQL